MDETRSFAGHSAARPPREPGRLRRRLRKTALVLALFALPVCAVLLFGGKIAATENQAQAEVPCLPPEIAGALDTLRFPTPVRGKDGFLYEQAGNYRLRYTLDPELQSRAEELLKKHRVPYGCVVMLEPATGRILAMAEHSSREPGLKGLCQRATFPAASLVKVITSAAALQTGNVASYSSFTYWGSPYILSEKKISPKFRPKWPQRATLGEALGQSNNIVFAKVGADLVGAARLLAALNAFGFNRDIPFEFPLQQSRAEVPSERYPLAQTAAGFGEVRISPLHAVLIAAAVADGGVMMRPFLVDAVTDAAGQVLFSSTPQPLMQVVEPGTARTLAEMMKNTVTQGTSRRSFQRRAKELVQQVSVAGKTGSLTGDDPPGRYEWFIGFAPADKPEIAVAALVVTTGEARHIKGAETAALMMKEHFRL